jgi:AraC-like DNA-binding protein
MNDDYLIMLKQKLMHIPNGEYEITDYSGDDNDSIISSSHITLKSYVLCKGQMENYPPYPGIELLFYRLLGSNVFSRHKSFKKYFLNTSALKEMFKTLYGSPIASYMKEYRMKRAMELLRTTDYHISVIANNVGYQSQSKFTAAFKDITNILPSEYRRLNR